MRYPLITAWYHTCVGSPPTTVLTDSTVSNGFPHGGYRRSALNHYVKLTKDSVPFPPTLATGVLVMLLVGELRSENTRLDHLATS